MPVRLGPKPSRVRGLSESQKRVVLARRQNQRPGRACSPEIASASLRAYGASVETGPTIRASVGLEGKPTKELISGVAKAKISKLTLLGRSEARIPTSPEEARLETFPNPARRNYRIHFETDDFTSLCPVTGQADFARIDINYIPDRLCVESKSLKFYLAAFRNVRAFNEAVTNRILDDFVRACAPRQAVVTAQFSARGGIALTVEAEYPEREKVGRNGP
jgi:7-cyano-7-deazaguanine reductase